MREITVAQLAERLDRGESPFILDIREPEKFADWHIPGARPLPVIEAMRRNEWGPLEARADEIPKDQPIVVVCNIGVSSAKATSVLERLGFAVENLAGGMQAWSGVHSEVPIELPGSPPVAVIQVRRNGKGCLSYVVASARQALVIDPSVESAVYAAIAERQGARIVMVLETHVHADHVSRARALAESTGATLVLPRNERMAFPYEAIDDGMVIQLGEVTLTAIHTPGHTGESTCYRLDDRALFTGDTLFIDSVGRPDLERGNEGAPTAAATLHRSLFGVLRRLPERLVVLPCHTEAGIPFDRQAVRARLGDLRGAMEGYGADLASFVPGVLARLGPKPPGFDRVIAVNEGKSPLPGEEDALALEAGPNRCAAK
jgi:glyoxylase-like metal-dependent hydrolase (beta-lactamase superfamily II)/rhodanese-related sulfurtransferase